MSRPINPNVPRASGVRRLVNAFGHSMDGLTAAFRSEEAFQIEVVLAAILLPVVFFLPVSAVERALLIASVLLVLIVELLNSAIEAIVDRISLERHPLSRQAKDIGSAAVLLTLLLLVSTWGLILFPGG